MFSSPMTTESHKGLGDWFTVAQIYRGGTRNGTKLSAMPIQVMHNSYT